MNGRASIGDYTSDSLDEAFARGRRSFFDGTPKPDNPYDDIEGMPSHPEFQCWNLGWELAREEVRYE